MARYGERGCGCGSRKFVSRLFYSPSSSHGCLPPRAAVQLNEHGRRSEVGFDRPYGTGARMGFKPRAALALGSFENAGCGVDASVSEDAHTTAGLETGATFMRGFEPKDHGWLFSIAPTGRRAAFDPLGAGSGTSSQKQIRSCVCPAREWRTTAFWILRGSGLPRGWSK